MEFVDLIKVPKVESVILRRPFRAPRQMGLSITGHHLIMSSKEEDFRVGILLSELHVLPAYFALKNNDGL